LVAIPLVYLIFVAVSVGQNSRGAGQIAGYGILAAFAVCWLAAPLLFSPLRPQHGFWLYWAAAAASRTTAAGRAEQRVSDSAFAAEDPLGHNNRLCGYDAEHEATTGKRHDPVP
jgi:hypothetical protein